MITCNRCKQDKPDIEYLEANGKGRGPDGRFLWCRNCRDTDLSRLNKLKRRRRKNQEEAPMARLHRKEMLKSDNLGGISCGTTTRGWLPFATEMAAWFNRWPSERGRRRMVNFLFGLMWAGLSFGLAMLFLRFGENNNAAEKAATFFAWLSVLLLLFTVLGTCSFSGSEHDAMPTRARP